MGESRRHESSDPGTNDREGHDRFTVDRGQLSAFLTNVDALLVTYDDDGVIGYASPAVRKLTGWSADEVEGRTIFELLHPDDLARVADNMSRWVGREGVTRDEHVRVRSAGGAWVELSMESVNGESIRPFGAGVATLRPLRASTNIEQELRARLVHEDRLIALARTFVNVDHHNFADGVRAALAQMGSLEGVDRITIWETDGPDLVFTHEWVAPTIIPRIGTLPPIPLGSAPNIEMLQRLEEVHIGDTSVTPESDDFLTMQIRCWSAVPMADAGRFAGFVAFSSERPHELQAEVHRATIRAAAGILAEALARHRAQSHLNYQATHDELTGLANRWVFTDEVLNAVEELARDETPGVSALLFDLDRFKVVNDSLGHGVGDDLLIAVAERLHAGVTAGELLARLGGDELIVLLRRAESVWEAEHRANELLALFAQPFRVGDTEILATASCGVAHFSTPPDDPGEVLSNADSAMYAAKELGRRRCVVFDETMRDRATRRQRYDQDLHRALRDDQLTMHYQPEFDIASGQVVGAEALLRWQHPEHGLLTAAEFVPVAEESGAIVDIGRWVMQETFAQLSAWQADPVLAGLVMRVNLSARQLAEPDFVDQVIAALHRSACDATLLCFEVTETALMVDPAQALQLLEKLHALGVTLAIDDFGTGYSSLAYLRTYPLDVLKIDRSFVAGLGHEPDDTTIVRTILSMAEAMGLAVTAEGVETVEQLDELRRLGCPRAQGYLLARPAPVDALRELAART